MKERMKKEI
jgi:actin-related protein